MHPGGEIHALAPRPRPAICFDAKDAMGAGSVRRNFGFLQIRGSDTIRGKEYDSLVKHGLCAGDDFSVQKCIPHSPGARLLVTELIQSSKKCRG